MLLNKTQGVVQLFNRGFLLTDKNLKVENTPLYRIAYQYITLEN